MALQEIRKQLDHKLLLARLEFADYLADKNYTSFEEEMEAHSLRGAYDNRCECLLQAAFDSYIELYQPTIDCWGDIRRIAKLEKQFEQDFKDYLHLYWATSQEWPFWKQYCSHKLGK